MTSNHITNGYTLLTGMTSGAAIYHWTHSFLVVLIAFLVYVAVWALEYSAIDYYRRQKNKRFLVDR